MGTVALFAGINSIDSNIGLVPLDQTGFPLKSTPVTGALIIIEEILAPDGLHESIGPPAPKG